MSFEPDESQRQVLLTWYSIDNPLHFEAKHPCLGLAGEAGELLNLLKKNEYKPNFSWWDCSTCGCSEYQHEGEKSPYACKSYFPKVFSELGDISFHLRILAYIKQLSFEELCEGFKVEFWQDKELVVILSWINNESARILESYLLNGYLINPRLRDITWWFLAILHKLDCSLSHLLDLNYKKLNSEETNHGWKDATRKVTSGI